MDQERQIMLLTFSQDIEAADVERRIIAGVVVPFNKVGMTSVGPVVFESGSISIPDATKIKLLANHDSTNPIGRAQGFQTSDDQILARLKFRNLALVKIFLSVQVKDSSPRYRLVLKSLHLSHLKTARCM